MNESNKNLAIWDRGEKSDGKALKRGQAGGGGTSINSYAMFKVATDIFGPVGAGWGYKILEERADAGAPIIVDDVTTRQLTHTIRLELWYKLDGEICTVEHYGHTPQLYYSRKNKYWIFDEEAPKKSLTDAIKKCLSMLGVYGDVYLGMTEDVGYMAEKQIEERIGKAETVSEKRERKIAELVTYVDAHIDLARACTGMSSLGGVMRKVATKLDGLALLPDMAAPVETHRTRIGRVFSEMKNTIEKDKK